MRRVLLGAGILALACAAAHAQATNVPRQPPEAAAERTRSNRPPAITYHLFYNDKQWGPFTLEELKQQAADKEFYIEDMVWKAGATEWKPASDYPELAFAPVYVEPEKPDEDAYHLDAGGESTGPFTLEEMKAKAEAGELTADSIVWSPQSGKWERAAALEALKPLFPAEAVPDEAATAPKPAEPVVPGEPDGPAAETGEPPAPPDAEAETPPPPPPDKPAVSYFVSVGGKATGPFSEEEVKAKVKSGEITAATYLWWKGADWTQAEKVPVFTSAFDEAPKAPPFDCTGHIAGGWERREVVQGQTIVTQTFFDANGQFTGIQALFGYPGSNFYGSWTAEAVGEKSCSIASQYRYPNLNNATAVYEIVDRMVMKDAATGLAIRRIR